jgi:predicted transposase YbfD/YdcC
MSPSYYFSGVEDFRVKARCRHVLDEILLLILLGIMSDCDDYSEIEDFGNVHIDWLRSTYSFEFPNGIPSEDTLERVMRHLKPSSVEDCMKRCIADLALDNADGLHISIDGKEHRGTIAKGKKHADVRTVSAWVGEHSLSFGQVQVDTKSNEITAIPALLSILDVEGAIVSIDAIGCQAAITEQIIDAKADYVIGLKANQKELFTQAGDWFEQRKDSFAQHSTLEKGHGRIEKRTAYVCNDLTFLDATEKFSKLRSIIRVDRERTTGDKVEKSVSYYISSCENISALQGYTYVRKHWSVENNLHWQLDITFGEDDSQLRKGNAPLNMNIIRKLALHLLTDGEMLKKKKVSIKRKRKMISMDINLITKYL